MDQKPYLKTSITTKTFIQNHRNWYHIFSRTFKSYPVYLYASNWQVGNKATIIVHCGGQINLASEIGHLAAAAGKCWIPTITRLLPTYCKWRGLEPAGASMNHDQWYTLETEHLRSG